MTFNKHLVKKGVLNMFHLHITKVQQKEKKVSYQSVFYRKYGIISGMWHLPTLVPKSIPLTCTSGIAIVAYND